MMTGENDLRDPKEPYEPKEGVLVLREDELDPE